MNIILIGMPGCGKSTAGVVLAKRLGYAFLDADLIIQQREGRLLQQIIDSDGVDTLLKAEQSALLSIKCDNTVIATGGSAVYSDEGMRWLKKTGKTVYIQLPLNEVRRRLGDLSARGVAGANEMSLEQIYAERTPLYERYADITIPADGMDISTLTEVIERKVLAHVTQLP